MKDKIANRPEPEKGQDLDGDKIIVVEDKTIVNPSRDPGDVYNDNGKLIIQDIGDLKKKILRNVLEIQESVAVATTSHEMLGNVAGEANKKAMHNSIEIALQNIHDLTTIILEDLK